jgi:hypothetical protein
MDRDRKEAVSGQCFNNYVVGSSLEGRNNSNPVPAIRNRSSVNMLPDALTHTPATSAENYQKEQTCLIQSYVIYSARSGISTQHACSGYNLHESGQRGAAKRLLVPAGATVSAESGTKDCFHRSRTTHGPIASEWSQLTPHGFIHINRNPATMSTSPLASSFSHTACNNSNTTPDILALHAAAFTMSDKPFPQQPQLHTVAEHRAAVLTYPGNLREALRQAKEDPKKTLFGVAQGIPSVFLTKVGPLSPSLKKPHTYDCRSWPRPNPTSFGSTLSTPYSTARPSTSKLAVAAMGDWTSKGSDVA